MKFVVLVKSNKDAEAGVMPKRDLLEKMGRFNEGLIKDGILLAGEGLRPTSKGTRLRFDGGRTTVIDGPFAESKELVAGFWIVQGGSREEIVERFARAPMHDGAVIEIRECHEAEDFGDELPDRERERMFTSASE